MTNKEKALALIGTFATGDTEKAKELLTELFSLCERAREGVKR